MTDEQITELLCNPRVQAFIRRQALEVLRAEVTPTLQLQSDQLRVVKVKEAPTGYITYKDAEVKYGLKYGTLRHYVHKGHVDGRRGLILVASLEDYLKRRAHNSTRQKAERLRQERTTS